MSNSSRLKRLSEFNSALTQFPGLLRVQKHSDQVETEWTSTVEGLQQALFAVLTSAAELLASDRVRRVRSAPTPIAPGYSSTRVVTTADAGAT